MDIDLCCETGLGWCTLYSRRAPTSWSGQGQGHVSDSGGGRRMSTVTAGVGVPANVLPYGRECMSSMLKIDMSGSRQSDGMLGMVRIVRANAGTVPGIGEGWVKGQGSA